ncbi:5'-adenylylsulfate reductase-like 5 [Platanthera guangdongensis]|uniref:5'-adenylylsulfate reductase-like 5 n=1 Tax=Platanthera guangdongensis TaxID=2320717 RepID=A0ABR2LDD3_9ASPA
MSASRHLLFLLRLAFISFLLSRGSSALQLTCPRSDVAGVVDSIRSPKCPIWIERSFPEEVDGDTLDKALAHVQEGAFYSVYFYASKCPFSQSFKPTFDSLSSMFPKIRHLAVEKSFAMPSFFSRYRIHGFPTLLLSTKTERIIYGGSKDLDSLICFYKKVTDPNSDGEKLGEECSKEGEVPATYFSVDQPKENAKALQPWRETTMKEFIENDPYLAFSILFITLRAFAYLFPKFIRRVKSSWAWLARLPIDTGIFSGLNQLLGRVLHVLNGLSVKARNFHKGAEGARVWASSLASVSLGESSSSRSALLDS